MAMIIRSLITNYYWINNEISDPRTANYLFIGSPWAGLTLLAAYLYFVNYLGPRLMKDRPAFNMDRLIMLYNSIQIVWCLYLTERCLTLGWWSKYQWSCEPVNYSNSLHSHEVSRGVWNFHMLKVFDLLDTVFFVLRKKNSQVTFLHVYHHTVMVIGTWVAVKYFAGGHGTFLGLVNSMVHVVMYSYYLLTSINPDYKKNIWWKKHITQMQMVQFLLICIQNLPVFLREDCSTPKIIGGVLLIQNTFMLFLFYDFYRKAYFPLKKTE